jgi:2-methylcitrate dehydratase
VRASHPFTWEESVEKFERLTADRIDHGLSREIQHAVKSLESIRIIDLMKLLGHVRAN